MCFLGCKRGSETLIRVLCRFLAIFFFENQTHNFQTLSVNIEICTREIEGNCRDEACVDGSLSDTHVQKIDQITYTDTPLYPGRFRPSVCQIEYHNKILHISVPVNTKGALDDSRKPLENLMTISAPMHDLMTLEMASPGLTTDWGCDWTGNIEVLPVCDTWNCIVFQNSM